jgi:hypothetical protein
MSHRHTPTGRAAATATRTATRTVAATVRAVSRDDGTRALDIELVPWDAPARVTDDGRRFYTEVWRPGSLVDGELMAVYADHVRGRDGELTRGEVIGRAAGIEHRAGGAHAVAELADTAEARRVYELARVGLARASIEFDPGDPADGDVEHTAAAPVAMSGVAIILPPNAPAYATTVTARARPKKATDSDADTDDDDQADDDDDETPAPGEIPANRQIRAAADNGNVRDLVRREVARFNLHPSAGRPGSAGPLARYRDAGELVTAARAASGEQAAELNAAFADAYRAHHLARRVGRLDTGRVFQNQITTDNPGVLPPSWLSEVFGIVDTGRPGIVALGGPRNPGPNGLDVYWPYYAGDLTTIVGQQTAEKTEITSVKVSFLRGQATLATYAGGSDVSFQLQRRSSPSYLAQYDRILQIAYGLTTENVFDDALLAGAGSSVVYDPAGTDTDGAVLKAALFSASAKVKAATGQPATVVLAASDMFLAVGSSPWLQPPQYGTTNIPGIASASTLRVNVSGLEVVEAVALPPGAMIITNDLAAAWLEEGPFLVTADDVAKLGTDVAIWGMGAPALFIPAGVVKTTPV